MKKITIPNDMEELITNDEVNIYNINIYDREIFHFIDVFQELWNKFIARNIEEYLRSLLREDFEGNTSLIDQYLNIWDDYNKNHMYNIMYLVFEELLIKGDIETIKDYNNKLKIFLDDNFNIESINERIKRGFRQIPNELDNRKRYKLILGTFPGQDTLNRGEGISYYLNKNNIFWLLMGIINYKNEINLGFNIFEKIKNDDLKGLNDQQNKFISSLKDIITRDTVHICYTTPMESLDKRRCPLVFTGKDLLATHCHLQEIEIEKIYTNGEPMDIKSIEIDGVRIKGMNYKSILRNLYGLEDYEKLVSSSGSNYRDSYEGKLIKRERKLNDNTDEDGIKEKIQSIKDLLLENDGYTQTLASSLFND